MQYLGLDEVFLKERNSYNTAFEICSQPRMWRNLLKDYEKQKKLINQFFDKIGLSKDFDIIFTGAGTSEYVGNILEPLLSNGEYTFKSIATTDIVNNPNLYLKRHKKTLLVSFARSGDSPESITTVDLVNQLVDNAYHLFITCNPEGVLAKRSKLESNTHLFLMPEGTNDKGFAMTSSFSTMLLAAILIFYSREKVEEIIDIVENEINNKYEHIKKIANMNHNRIVVLGSGIFKGLAQELTLKVMELSKGIVVAKYDTPLGFRHGPKSIVNKETIVFLLDSICEYARKYECDLFKEMKEEDIATLVTYSVGESEISNYTNEIIRVNSEIRNNILAIFTYLVYGQMYAFFKSQYLNLTTDNPFPSGVVNRVVKKFEIHKYDDK